MEKTCVILVNLGTPSAPTPSAIRTFLRCFLSDKRVVPLPALLWKPLLNLLILPFRSRRLVSQYKAIWQEQGSPLEVYMQDLVQTIQAQANFAQQHVCYAMSYSQPRLHDVIQQTMAAEYSRLVILPLYPQYASSTTGAVFDQVFAALNKKRVIPSLSVINNYHIHPVYIKALANSVTQYWQQHAKPQRLVMSFHGIPQSSVDKGDPYAKQCEATARALAEVLALEPSEWQLVYQSRFGKATWLQPYCDQVLQELPGQGITDIQIICPGFSMDCLETLEEIAEMNQQKFLAAGGKSYAYIPALNASQAHAEFILALLQEK